MTLSQVHYTQQIYRKLVDAMSRPGKIQSVADVENSNSHSFDCYEATAGVLVTLLDQEVTYSVISEDSVNVSTMITAYTLAKEVPVEEADFIIVLEDAPISEIEEALTKCKVGTLRDPHQSSTWIIESPNLAAGNELQLKGPGIETEAALQLHFPEKFWEIRADLLKEFPLGIDLVFTNDHKQLVCMPRTTNVERLGVM